MNDIIRAQFNVLDMHEYRKMLNKHRAAAIKALWSPQEAKRIEHLESLYGKYLFLPLDLPQPLANDKFPEWWETYSKPISKIKPDITEESRTGVGRTLKDDSGVYGGDGIFNSINSPTSINTVFESNIRSDAEDYVDNLVEYLDALKTTRKTYNFWSSNRQINYHRDTGPWILDLGLIYLA